MPSSPRALLACALLGLVAACGGGDGGGKDKAASPAPSQASPTPTASPTPGTRQGQLMLLVKNIAIGEENYYVESEGKYLAFSGQVPATFYVEGLRSIPGVNVGVALLPTSTYCVVAVDTTTDGFAMFISPDRFVRPPVDPSTIPAPCKALAGTLRT